MKLKFLDDTNIKLRNQLFHEIVNNAKKTTMVVASLFFCLDRFEFYGLHLGIKVEITGSRNHF